MKFKLAVSLLVLMVCGLSGFAQNDITIKKKMSVNIPDLPSVPGMDDLRNRPSTIYIKGPRMRTDVQAKVPGKMGGKETFIFSTILQCDKQRSLSFTNKNKKYYQEAFGGSGSAGSQSVKKGGYVTLTGGVTDTGERAKLFGYEAKHLKQSLTITPGPNACQKETLHIEIEGWYAEMPEFSCPMRRKQEEFQWESSCADAVIDEAKGVVAGVPLKEIKKVTTNGMTITVEEEATGLTKGSLADTLFEPPPNYTAANTLKEVQESTGDYSGAQTGNTPTTPASPSNNSSPTFAPPAAGLENAAIGEKKPGMIRIGVVEPKVTTPESKQNPNAGDEIATATQKSLVELLKAENVEAIPLETEFPENECKEKGCDYIFYANVTQKRSSGFGKALLMGAAGAAAGMIPGVGGLVAATAGGMIMGQTMGKMAKARDEFSLDYQVVTMDKTVLSKAATKNKTEKDGEDVLTPQIKQASVAVLAEIAKKQMK
jgi:hypothetical protein